MTYAEMERYWLGVAYTFRADTSSREFYEAVAAKYRALAGNA